MRLPVTSETTWHFEKPSLYWPVPFYKPFLKDMPKNVSREVCHFFVLTHVYSSLVMKQKRKEANIFKCPYATLPDSSITNDIHNNDQLYFIHLKTALTLVLPEPFCTG
jgi:hypothetical protein